MHNYEPNELSVPEPKPQDPRISTTRIICARRAAVVPRFVGWPAMSSLLFLFSALCLLFGAWTVFASLADDELQILERFAMVGAVHGYELALVSVAVLLCRFQKYNADAIGPIFLGAAFCVGSAVTLDLVSIDAPWQTLMCGLCGVIFSLAKGRALTWINHDNTTWLWVIPVAALVLINVLWPGIMGIQRYYAESGLYTQWWWMPAWASVLLCALFIVLGIINTVDLSSDRLRPFLRRVVLRWTVALILVACSLLHLLVLGYLHNLDVTTGEFIPLLVVLAIGIVDLRRRALGPAPLLDYAILSVPILCSLCAVINDQTGILSNPRGTGALFNPAVVMGFYGLGLITLWYRQRHDMYLSIAVFATFISILIWQVQPTFYDFNWNTSAWAISISLFSIALYRRNAPVLAAASCLLTASIYAIPTVNQWLSAYTTTPPLIWTAISGITALAIMAWQPQQFSRWTIRLQLMLTTMSIFSVCTHASVILHSPALAAVMIVVVHGVLIWRTKDFISLAPLLFPAAYFIPSIIPAHKGWLAVMVAFALLAIGTAASYARVRHQQKIRITKSQATPTPITVPALEPLSA